MPQMEAFRTLRISFDQKGTLETIRPKPSRMRRIPSADSISLAIDGNPPVCKSTSRDENSPTSPTIKGTHTLRRSTSMEKLSPTLRKIRSALSIKSTSLCAAIEALEPKAISVLRAIISPYWASLPCCLEFSRSSVPPQMPHPPHQPQHQPSP